MLGNRKSDERTWPAVIKPNNFYVNIFFRVLSVLSGLKELWCLLHCTAIRLNKPLSRNWDAHGTVCIINSLQISRWDKNEFCTFSTTSRSTWVKPSIQYNNTASFEEVELCWNILQDFCPDDKRIRCTQLPTLRHNCIVNWRSEQTKI